MRPKAACIATHASCYDCASCSFYTTHHYIQDIILINLELQTIVYHSPLTALLGPFHIILGKKRMESKDKYFIYTTSLKTLCLQSSLPRYLLIKALTIISPSEPTFGPRVIAISLYTSLLIGKSTNFSL